MSDGDKFKGKAKETTGRVTGDDQMEAEGKAQHTKGKMKEKGEEAKRTARGAGESMRDAISGDGKR